MRYIGIIILLVLCLTLLLFTGCKTNTVKPEIASGNLENQEDINQSSNNFQSSSTGSVEEPAIEDTEEPVEEPGIVYPQQWATGDGTVENPWANNCIQKAYDAVPEGGTIFLKAGYYQLAAEVTIAKEVHIIGEGMDKTIVRTADDEGFYFCGEEGDASYSSIKNLTVDGDAQTDGVEWLHCISIDAIYVDYDHLVFENLELKNAGRQGLGAHQVNYSSFKNIYSHDNWEHGMEPSSNTTGRNLYNHYQDIYCWDNGSCGFLDRGADPNEVPVEQTNNVYDNIQCWGNGDYGIQIAYQTGVTLSNSFSRGNEKYGISLYNVEDVNVNNCLVTLNGIVDDFQAFSITDSKNINLANVIVKNNWTGIDIRDSSDVTLTSCQSYDDRDTPLQLWGLEIIGTVTGVSLLNCKLTPNKNGDISNSSGAAVTVITETDLLLLSL